MSLLPIGFGASGDDDYTIDDSLRFRSSATAYLSRTPATAGNRKTWTWSAWVKRGSLGTNQNFFSVRTGSTTRTVLRFASDSIDWLDDDINFRITTSAVYRDVSAWYHIIAVIDTTQATSTNRLKLYVNGEQVTAFSNTNYPSQNYEAVVNDTLLHAIGREGSSSNDYLDGYLTEVNFIDGQALTPEDFGEYDDNGTWKALSYTGTYGTNGFYLPMKPTTQADGFNTVLYTGNGGTQSITGVGFTPDFVWIKGRSDAQYHVLQNAVTGAGKTLFTNVAIAETGNAGDFISSFDSDGITVNNTYAGGTNNSVNGAGKTYVAWCWKANGSGVSNTDGSITSTVSANTTAGFSIVSYTGTGSAATVGHGLSSAPEMIIIKNRSGVYQWIVQHSSLGATKYLTLSTSDAAATSSAPWNDTAPTSSVFSLGTSSLSNRSANNFIAYCFSEVSGVSKFDSYTGNGSTTGPTITTGFRPAWVMMKSSSNASTPWQIFDNTREPNNPRNQSLIANGANAEPYDTNSPVVFTDTGFQLTGGASSWNNYNTGTWIYMAFADTRDAQFNFDASGNNNNFDANNINSNAESETTYDLMKDTPSLVDENAGNFCTMNALNGIGTISDGNMTLLSTVANWQSRGGTIAVSSGKWYWEADVITIGSYMQVGMVGSDVFFQATDDIQEWSTGYGYYSYNGNKNHDGSNSSYGATYTTGDLIGIALDLDAGTIEFYKNNVSQGVAFTGISGEFIPAFSVYGGSGKVTANFGQRPFAYTPPTGFLKLNTFNLPDSTIEKGSDYFNPVLYTGNGGAQAITGVGFQPDFIWAKSRSNAYDHLLVDVVRGGGFGLASNSTAVETASGWVSSFNADGFTYNVGGATPANANGATYVAWNWLANGSGVLNEVGSIDSTVSANTEAGFSIVSFAAQSGTYTVGHGLNSPPEIILGKNRNINGGLWYSFTTAIDGGVDYLSLDTTAAAADAESFGVTAPTSTVFTGASAFYYTTGNMITYCFHSVEGYSSIGSYTGNGSTDGTFVYTGFRPAFLLTKRANASGGAWILLDSARSTYNVVQNILQPNSNAADTGSTYNVVDFLSNGFKFRITSDPNTSGVTNIYMAFAENPFKNSNAR